MKPVRKLILKERYEINVPFHSLLRMCGVPLDAKILYVDGSRENGLTVTYER